jgi:DNA-binding transcriptional MerR regulator
MKASTVVLLGTTTLFAATSLHLWSELGDARGKLDDSAEATRRLNARLGVLDKVHAAPRQQVAAPQVAQARPTSAPAAQPPSHAVLQGLVINGGLSRPQVHVESPATARMARNQERAHMRRMYQDFAHELGLSVDETNKLYDLLTEQQRGFSVNEGEDPKAAMEKWQATFRQKEAQVSAQIAALIGDANLATLKDYQATMGARSEVDAIRNQLTFAELPMTDAQRKRLIKATLEDQQAYPHPNYSASMSQAELQQMSFSWQREHTERVLARVKQVLTEEQYQVYEDSQRSQIEMQEQAMLNPGKDIVFSDGRSMTVTRSAGPTIEGDSTEYSAVTTTTP